MPEQCRAYQRIGVSVAGRAPTYRNTPMQTQITCRINTLPVGAHGTLNCSQMHGTLRVGPDIVLAVSCMTRLHWMVETEPKPYGRARPDGPQIRKLGDFLIWGHKEDRTVAGSQGTCTGAKPVSPSTLAPYVHCPGISGIMKRLCGDAPVLTSEPCLRLFRATRETVAARG